MAGNNGPLYPKVDHYWFKVAHNSEPLALQVLGTWTLSAIHWTTTSVETGNPSPGVPTRSKGTSLNTGRTYLESQWLIIMGYCKPIMVYFGV